jgi:Carbonic anhydrase
MNATAQLLDKQTRLHTGFAHAALPAAPRLRVAILTCMDARIYPARALGLEPGDAHVIRNAGGIVTDDVLRSLSISQHHLGTEEIRRHSAHSVRTAHVLRRSVCERPGALHGPAAVVDRGHVRRSRRLGAQRGCGESSRIHLSRAPRTSRGSCTRSRRDRFVRSPDGLTLLAGRDPCDPAIRFR